MTTTMTRLLRSSDPSFANLSEIVLGDEGEYRRPILFELERSSVVYSLEMYQRAALPNFIHDPAK